MNSKKRNDNSDNHSVKVVTPLGEAVFPKIVVPDTKFDPDGAYTLKLRLPDGTEADELIAKIDAVVEAAYNQAVEDASNPAMKKKVKKAEPSYSREYDRNTGEDTGNWLFNFKMKASGISKRTGKKWNRQPAIFDSKGIPITDLKSNDDVWTGSLVRVAAELRPFYSPSFGAGCSQTLEAVQIIHFVSGSNKSAEDYGFNTNEEGYTVSNNTPFDTEAPSTVKDGDDGDF